MVSEEQRRLATYIKDVHMSLRQRSSEIGADKAWQEHLNNKEVLIKYASCMKSLAQNFWLKNVDGGNISCRIHWVENIILKYFVGGGVVQQDLKEERKSKIFGLQSVVNYKNDLFTEPYKLLDVGSCYNPLKECQLVEVFPIDLQPATPDVRQCNFIQAQVMNSAPENWFYLDPLIFPVQHFDVVLFSLLLEYMPSPSQRYQCARKAYLLLKERGLLLIITPDSKHASANAKLMSKWKQSLACIGFVQVELIKLKYLYCMAYRKSSCKEYAKLLYKITDVDDTVAQEMLTIPQDFNNYHIQPFQQENNSHEPTVESPNYFIELPNCE